MKFDIYEAISKMIRASNDPRSDLPTPYEIIEMLNMLEYFVFDTKNLVSKRLYVSNDTKQPYPFDVYKHLRLDVKDWCIQNPITSFVESNLKYLHTFIAEPLIDHWEQKLTHTELLLVIKPMTRKMVQFTESEGEKYDTYDKVDCQIARRALSADNHDRRRLKRVTDAITEFRSIN